MCEHVPFFMPFAKNAILTQEICVNGYQKTQTYSVLELFIIEQIHSVCHLDYKTCILHILSLEQIVCSEGKIQLLDLYIVNCCLLSTFG